MIKGFVFINSICNFILVSFSFFYWVEAGLRVFPASLFIHGFKNSQKVINTTC